MDKEVQEEIKEKFGKFVDGIPYLEETLKEGTIKQIEDTIAYNIYLLHRIHKKATGKSTGESIQELNGRLWWFHDNKHRKEEKKRRYLDVKKQYSKWAKEYDVEANIAIFLEEKHIADFFPKVKGKEVLDFGCGTGRHAIPLAKKGANVTCVDLTQAMLNKAQKKAKKAGVKIQIKRQDITKFVPQKKYDLVISTLVLDHIKNLKGAISVINNSSQIGTEVIISNMHPETMRKDVDPKTGRARGYLVEGFKTDQFFHPLEEYVELFLKYGFILEKVKEIAPTEKDLKSKKMTKFRGLRDKAVILLMKFKKIK